MKKMSNIIGAGAKKFLPLCLAMLIVCITIPAMAQEGAMTKEKLMGQLKTRESQLGLDQAKADMERAKASYDQEMELFNAKVVTLDDLNDRKRAYEQMLLAFEQAKIGLEKTRLDLLKTATLITLLDAKKYRNDQNQIMVSITLRNESNLEQAKTAMEGAAGNVGNAADLLAVENVVASLKGTVNSAGPNETPRFITTIIGDPYQQVITKLKLGEEKTIQYKLLAKEIEDINLQLSYTGDTKEYSVFLKKEATQDIPTVQSTQYAQEGQLGTTIRYDLTFERLGKTEQSFAPVVLNLPKEISFAFIDPGSKARITHLKFTDQISKQNLDLELSIPENLDKSLVDQNIGFSILVCFQGELKNIYDMVKKYEGKNIPAEEIAKIKGNKSDLILIPKGKGKLEIIISNLYKEIDKGDELSIKMSVLNAGTMELLNVTPKIDYPLEWDGVLDPVEVKSLEAGKKTMFSLNVTLPKDLSVGEYSLKISSKGFSGVETVEAPEKIFTVRVAAKSNIFGTLTLVVLLIGLVVGIAVYSIKISRR